jgi:NAD(P)-dependent dehydrogenase (short-subunit alcohol dehydrogenase family)
MNVLITGALGGIGKAVTNYLVKKGLTVYAIDVLDDCDILGVYYYKCDITDKNSLNSILDKLKASGVILDAIINVAGIFYIDSFIEISDENLKKIFDINLMGAMLVNKTFYPLLSKKGKILITTSEVAPLSPMPFNAIYNTTKTALETYAKGLRQELNLLGQKVISIRPGAFNTSLSQGALVKTKELQDKTTLYKKQSNKFYRLVKGFMGTPKNPDKIAKTYFKALTSKKNKIVYKKNTNKLLKLLSIFPDRLQCFIIKLVLKPKKTKKSK